MSAPSKIVVKAVNQAFEPMHIGQVIKNAIFSVAATALVMIAAQHTDGWISIALWVWAAQRFARTVYALAFIEQYDTEKRRRMGLLPIVHQRLLRTGSSYPTKTPTHDGADGEQL